MASATVEPQLVHLLLTDVHSATELILVDLVALELDHCKQLELAGQIRNRGRISVTDHVNEGGSVTLAIKEFLLD
jgi:hypothetical protein